MPLDKLIQTGIKKLSEKVPTPERTSHPFYMYDMIREIPKGFESTLEVIRESELELASEDPLVFTGNGTAFYAALMGSQILSLSTANWRTIQSFELTNYERRKMNSGMVVGVSHSGITKSTVDGLSLAKSKGAHTIAITHFHDRPISKVADRTLVVGNGPDKSRCHTKTYVDSAAAVLELSLHPTRPLDGDLDNVRKEFESELAHKLESVISTSERPVKKTVSEFVKISKMFFVGAGPNLVTAKEAALKIKESSFLAAEAFELEEILHGPWAVFDGETLVVIIVPSGPSQQRAKDLIAASRRVGAKTMVISDSSDLSADLSILVPSTHEYLFPFVSIIPLYLFAYFLALEKGNNPDFLRYLDPKYWRARQIIFPPGTH